MHRFRLDTPLMYKMTFKISRRGILLRFRSVPFSDSSVTTSSTVVSFMEISVSPLAAALIVFDQCSLKDGSGHLPILECCNLCDFFYKMNRV